MEEVGFSNKVVGVEHKFSFCVHLACGLKRKFCYIPFSWRDVHVISNLFFAKKNKWPWPAEVVSCPWQSALIMPGGGEHMRTPIFCATWNLVVHKARNPVRWKIAVLPRSVSCTCWEGGPSLDIEGVWCEAFVPASTRYHWSPASRFPRFIFLL